MIEHWAEAAKEFREYAVTQYPREACAVVLACNRLQTVRNVHPEPELHFSMDQAATDGLLVRGEVRAVLHSHTNGAHRPSASDMAQQEASGLPWGVVACNDTRATEVLWWGDSLPPLPLVGRDFVHGVADCYALVRDFYRLRMGIVLPVFPRDHEWWHDPKQDLLVQGFPAAGFREVPISEIRAGDVVMGSVLSTRINHCGVYLGSNLMLHHLCDRPSTREPFMRWKKFVHKAVRHDSLWKVEYPVIHSHEVDALDRSEAVRPSGRAIR